MSVLQSGVNNAQPDELFEFTNGVDVDCRLAKQEVAVQKAWLNGLALLGYFAADEVRAIEATLDEAVASIEAGTFVWNVRDEDIHMHLENFVTKRHGELGKKMHVGRSRNDLIATTLRLYVADETARVAAEVETLVQALVAKAETLVDVLIPGMTHLQHGQPVRFAHVLLAHAQGFRRDIASLHAARTTALAEMPQGAAALAGTPLPMDLAAMAKRLGFAAPAANSYDAVGNRDFMLQTLSALAQLGVHLGRLAEDTMYWSATPVGLIKLPPRWSTGSSIMPNKRNPDVPELTRAHSAHMIGAQADGYMLMRTVPTSYGSDLHELKGVVMRSLDCATKCLSVWPGFVTEMQVNPQRAEDILHQGHILATELADALAAEGVPFRDAYKIVAAWVKDADAQGVQVHQLPLEAMNKAITELGHKPMQGFETSFEKAVERRSQTGGTARARVLEQLAALKR